MLGLSSPLSALISIQMRLIHIGECLIDCVRTVLYSTSVLLLLQVAHKLESIPGCLRGSGDRSEDGKRRRIPACVAQAVGTEPSFCTPQTALLQAAEHLHLAAIPRITQESSVHGT